MKNAWRPWTSEDDRQLREMFEVKKSVPIMALRLKRTEMAIRGRLSVLKLSLKQGRLVGPRT
jgi:hypothetical protein